MLCRAYVDARDNLHARRTGARATATGPTEDVDSPDPFRRYAMSALPIKFLSDYDPAEPVDTREQATCLDEAAIVDAKHKTRTQWNTQLAFGGQNGGIRQFVRAAEPVGGRVAIPGTGEGSGRHLER